MEYTIEPARKVDGASMYIISVKAHTDSYYQTLIPPSSMDDFLEHYRVSTHKRQRFLSSINRKIDDTNWVIYVAKSAERVVGYKLAYRETDGSVQLKGLFVDPKYQRQGIGSGLFAAGLKLAVDGAITQLTVISTNIVAKKMYEKYGFKVVGRSDKKFFGAEQDIMEKP